jgi:RNA-directed DNA polymerase
MKAKACMPARQLNLVLPLAHEATDTRTTDTTGPAPAWSGAVTPLIGDSLRPGDVTSKHRRSTPATTPSTRTSTTATRTTTPRAGKVAARGPSADSHAPASPTGEAPFAFEALVQAYLDCRANKRNTASALQFEQALESNLWTLYQQLTAGTYRPGRSICFVVTRPKPREVWAAEFPDRVVHHLLYNHIAPRFHAGFTAASSACIPGRGTLYAATRLAHDVRSITRNWSRPAHYLKCDLANFFVSIDKHVLRAQLARRVHEPWWLRLAEQILFHDPRLQVDVRSTARLLALVPPHKSLFNAPADTGLPIGNLSSQFFANVFLDGLDQFVKHRLQVRHYVRYVDDFVLLHESPLVLNQALDRIAAFLPEQLHAQLNPRKTVLQPLARAASTSLDTSSPRGRTPRGARPSARHCGAWNT